MDHVLNVHRIGGIALALLGDWFSPIAATEHDCWLALGVRRYRDVSRNGIAFLLGQGRSPNSGYRVPY